MIIANLKKNSYLHEWIVEEEGEEIHYVQGVIQYVDALQMFFFLLSLNFLSTDFVVFFFNNTLQNPSAKTY